MFKNNTIFNIFLIFIFFSTQTLMLSGCNNKSTEPTKINLFKYKEFVKIHHNSMNNLFYSTVDKIDEQHKIMFEKSNLNLEKGNVLQLREKLFYDICDTVKKDLERQRILIEDNKFSKDIEMVKKILFQAENKNLHLRKIEDVIEEAREYSNKNSSFKCEKYFNSMQRGVEALKSKNKIEDLNVLIKEIENENYDNVSFDIKNKIKRSIEVMKDSYQNTLKFYSKNDSSTNSLLNYNISNEITDVEGLLITCIVILADGIGAAVGNIAGCVAFSLAAAALAYLYYQYVCN